MPGEGWTFDAEVWRWEAQATWFFVTVPDAVSDEIADIADGTAPRAGFGSVRVQVRCGGSTWATSVFPDATRKAYVLPLKKAVRTAEGLDEGSRATIHLALVDR